MRAGLFDLNGTIVNDNHLLYGFCREMCVEHNAQFPSVWEYFESLSSYNNGYEEVYQSFGVDMSREELTERYKEYYMNHVHRVALFPNVEKVLWRLKKEGLFLGLITLQDRELVEPIFTRSDLGDIFDRCIYSSHKKMAHILKMLSVANVSPHRAFYMGDMPSDTVSANRAAVKSVGFYNGYIERFALSNNANCIISHWQSLLSVLEL